MTSLSFEQVFGCVLLCSIFCCFSNANMQARKHTHTHTHHSERVSSGSGRIFRISPAVFLEHVSLVEGLSLPPNLAHCLGLDLPPFATVPAFLPLVPRTGKKPSLGLYLLCHHFISAFEDNFFYQHFLPWC